MITEKFKPGIYSFSRNMMEMVVNTSLGNASGVKLKIVVNVEDVPYSGLYHTLYMEELLPDGNGDVTFLLQKQLDVCKALQNWVMPPWSSAKIHKLVSGFTRYTITVYEYLNGVQQSYITPYTNAAPALVYKGGISIEQYRKGAFWVDRTIPLSTFRTQKFWTWFEKGKTVSVDEPHYLMWQVQQANTYDNIRVTAYYDNGTQLVVDSGALGVLGSANVGELYMIPVGVNQLKQNSLIALTNSGSKLKSYKVAVWTLLGGFVGDQPLTEDYDFVLDYPYGNRTRYFLFNNSLGGVDTVRLFFNEDTAGEYNSQETNSILKYDYWTKTQLPAVIGRQAVTERLRRKAETGDTLRKQDEDAMRQWALAESIVEVVRPGKLHTNVRYVPIVNESKKIFFYKRLPNSPIYKFEVEYAFGFENQNYTPEDESCSWGNLPLPLIYTAAFPALGVSQRYVLSVYLCNGGNITPTPPPLGFASALDLLAWVQTYWYAYGVWTINTSGQLQLENTTCTSASLTISTITLPNMTIVADPTTPWAALSVDASGNPCKTPYNSGGSLVYPNIKHAFKFKITNNTTGSTSTAFSFILGGNFNTMLNAYIKSCTVGAAVLSGGTVTWTGSLAGGSSVYIEIAADVTVGGKADVWTGGGTYAPHVQPALNTANNNACVPLSYSVTGTFDPSVNSFSPNNTCSIAGTLAVSCFLLYGYGASANAHTCGGVPMVTGLPNRRHRISSMVMNGVSIYVNGAWTAPLSVWCNTVNTEMGKLGYVYAGVAHSGSTYSHALRLMTYYTVALLSISTSWQFDNNLDGVAEGTASNVYIIATTQYPVVGGVWVTGYTTDDVYFP